MPVETSWLEIKNATPGLDQLGIRATAIRMYTHLVPGITNVTDRARYFAIHPWIIHHWAQTVATDDPVAFRHLIRRVECVLALAEKVRVYGSEEESYGVVGTVRLNRWLRDQADPRDKDYRVPLRQLETEYFANKWGSFGQYYGGSEADLKLVRWEAGLPRMTPLGQQLAAAFAAVARRCELPTVIESDDPKISALRKIGSVAGFDRLSAAEITVLRDLVLDLSARYGDKGVRRRETCLLLLSITNQRRSPVQGPIWNFLEAALHGRCENGIPYVCPASLAGRLALWRTYAFQEFLAFALEVMLASAVEVLQELEITRVSAPATVGELAGKTVECLPKHLIHLKVVDLLEETVGQLKEVSLDSTLDAYEEEALRKSAAEALKKGEIAVALECAFKLVGRITTRLPRDADPYAQFLNEQMDVDEQRFGLRDIQRFMTRHANSSLGDALSELITTVINVHLRVATAKLAYNGDFTFKLLYDNGRLRKSSSRGTSIFKSKTPASRADSGRHRFVAAARQSISNYA